MSESTERYDCWGDCEGFARIKVADRLGRYRLLLNDALALRDDGGEHPFADETWMDWDQRAREFLNASRNSRDGDYTELHEAIAAAEARGRKQAADAIAELEARIDKALLALDAWGPIDDADEDVQAVYRALAAGQDTGP